MYGGMILLHLLGAAVWTGGHLVLALAVLPKALREQSVERLTEFEGAYERLGIPALFVQIVTGLWLAHRMVPEPGRWLLGSDPLARGVQVKLLLLALTLGLALHARLRLIPRLTAERLPLLAAHILAVTVLALLFLVAGTAFRAGWWF